MQGVGDPLPGALGLGSELSVLLSGFLSRHCPECARLWLPWLSPLGAWLSPGACNYFVISALAYAKKLGSKKIHPVRNPRFASFRTQPLENLSAAIKLPIK